MNIQQTKRSSVSSAAGPQLCILFALFVITLLATSVLSSWVGGFIRQERTALLVQSSLQSVLVFILPAYVMARTVSRSPLKLLGGTSSAGYRPYLATLILYLLATPALNQIVFWNENMSLPESMKAIEQSMRAMEDASAALTDVLLSDTSVWGLLSGVLVIGCLTGFAEEIFFRGTLQRILYGKMSKHLAIWTAAIVFSVLHFQFFGFIPRMLLGAGFGYLYYWSRTLWVPAFAHALNNSVVVVLNWLALNGYIPGNVDRIGVIEIGFPYPAIISVVLTCAAIYILKDKFLKADSAIIR